ncbi:DUF1680 family protein [Flavobacterium fryxellicola]|uniref:Six-hairpin glycosidase n=1 Tax=Flavobacterium fryxellicola TaxID=249352 RepID=A0A167U804_9FLAO|nr:beta-L-arabinofuranosidase domain-containing protein [Flavobacterium fryxellicola]OAB25344.1 hypothetical protein FBFR_15285 [Flavobacterium fryxellicola]SHN75001.1 DUF1680 family protein [Flavobacterium fryxellicola]
MKSIFLAFLFACASTGTVFSQELSINGKWKYITNTDQPEFSKANFNDSSWADLDRLEWKDDIKTTAVRVLWLRKKVFIPSSLKKEYEKTGSLSLSMGKIRQSDETYLNGKLIGSNTSGDTNRNYLIEQDHILWDKENILAIRMTHWGHFLISKTPTFKSASADLFFKYSTNLKNGDIATPIANESLYYQINISNSSTKILKGKVVAAFYSFKGEKVNAFEKDVELVAGTNTITFLYKAVTPFIKVVYTLTIPQFQYSQSWNAEYGFENIVYNKTVPQTAYLVKEKFQNPEINHLKIEGWLGEKIDINTKKRLYKVDEEAILTGFINRPGAHSWIGEHVGKFLEAACNTYANNGDARLKIQIDRTAQQLIAAQLQDGYLGTYDENSHWTSWDVWSHKYNIIGLLRYYELSGFEPALQACKKIGDLICAKFGEDPDQKNIIKSGAHVGMAATSIIDPMTDLYRFTGDKKYLDFCYYIIKSYDSSNGPRIITDLDSLKRVDKIANGKAYEMMSNIVGIIKLYRVTNDPSFLKPVLLAWNDIASKRLYITGTTSSMEHFQDDFVLPGENHVHMGEGCVTTTWLQLNYQLFCTMGDIKYLDELERSVYNHLIGAEDPQTGGVSYYTALMGKKEYGTNITCCMSSIPRGIAMIPMFVNGEINETPAFLFYEAGVYKTNLRGGVKVTFKTTTNLATDGKILISVSPSKTAKFKVLFRKPYWAKNFVIKINNKIENSEGELVSIERTWKKGDQIEISVSVPVEILEGGKSYPNRISFQLGPQVLVFDQKLNKILAEEIVLNKDTISLVKTSDKILPENWCGNQVYAMDGESKGQVIKIYLVPFADAGQTKGIITTWLKTK